MRRQLRALGAGRYEVAVRRVEDGTAERRRWTAAEIEGALPWLKRVNAQGRQVLIRPAPEEDRELVLVGGVDAATVEAMRAAGREPAAVVESAPGRFEAWVRIPASDGVRRLEVARQLATERGADLEGVRTDWFGHLAGFTNPAQETDGRRPWVLCRSSTGREASAGATLVEEANQRLDARAQEAARQREAHQRAQRAAAAERSRDRGGLER